VRSTRLLARLALPLHRRKPALELVSTMEYALALAIDVPFLRRLDGQ
jgi:hypothetical protein